MQNVVYGEGCEVMISDFLDQIMIEIRMEIRS